MRRLWVVGALLALGVLGAAPAAARRAARPHPVLVRLTSTPALFPAYSPRVHDYVVRCVSGKTTRFTTWAAAGTVARIGAARGGPRVRVPLRAGQAVTITATRGGRSEAYHVRCLPQDFPAWTATVTGPTEGFTIAAPTISLGQSRAHYVAIFDANGVPVWWYRVNKPPIDAKLEPGPAIVFTTWPVDSHTHYELHSLDGKLLRRVVSPDGIMDDHELQRDAAGDAYYILYVPQLHVDLTAVGGPADGTVLEPVIEEVSPAGKLLWRWSAAGHVDPAESGRWIPQILAQPMPYVGGTGFDFFHANALSLAPGVVLLSLRQTDAVYAIDRATGRILWKLGGTPTPESLTVVGDPDLPEPLGGQHDVRLLPDGSVTLFDDGTGLNRPPRAVHYAIDTTARTATFLGQLVDPALTSSLCCGSARLRPNGDWLVSWGGDPVVAEYRPDGTPLLRLAFADDLFSYRAVPVSPKQLTIGELRAGMDAMAGG